MKTQSQALAELLDLIDKKGSRELRLGALAWVCRNIRNKQATIELSKPMELYTLKEQWALKERLARSFSASLVSSGYDSYTEVSNQALHMNVLMIDPDSAAPALSESELVRLGYQPVIEDKTVGRTDEEKQDQKS